MEPPTVSHIAKRAAFKDRGTGGRHGPMAVQVTGARYLGHHRLWLSFADESSGLASVEDLLGAPGEDPRWEPGYFAAFDVRGNLRWPDGSSLDSKELHRRAQELPPRGGPSRWLDLLRLVVAGLLVFGAVLSLVGLLGRIGAFESAPPMLVGLGISAVMLWRTYLAFRRFNGPGVDPRGHRSEEEELECLARAGELEAEEVRVHRALEIDDTFDGGQHHLLELEGGRLLFLSGFELQAGDAEAMQGSGALTLLRRHPSGELLRALPNPRGPEGSGSRVELSFPELATRVLGADVPIHGEVLDGPELEVWVRAATELAAA